MKIDKRWLVKMNACTDGKAWFSKQAETDAVKVAKALIEDNKLSWANWLISRALAHENKIRYAVYAAEQVIKIYEDKYPGDERPRKAINAAKAVIKNPTKENKDAAYAAYAAAYAADAADAAAYAAYALRIKILRYGIRLLSKQDSQPSAGGI